MLNRLLSFCLSWIIRGEKISANIVYAKFLCANISIFVLVNLLGLVLPSLLWQYKGIWQFIVHT